MNSKAKGKRGELQAAAYLRRLGFKSARRGAQHKGGPDSPDVVVDELPNLHFEVKNSEGIGLGTKALADALDQAERDAGEGRTGIVMWKNNRSKWGISWRFGDAIVTMCDDDTVAYGTLRILNRGMAA